MDTEDVRKIKVTASADVILVCDTVELHVSSKTLTTASPVFRAMFNGQFAEGQALRESTMHSLPSVHLPDDDGDLMEALCHALHHQTLGPMSHSQRNWGVFLRFAELVDKYQCAAAVTTAMTPVYQCVKLDDSRSLIEEADFLGAVYLLDDAEQFQKLTGDVVRKGRSSGRFALNIYDREDAVREYILKRANSVAERVALFLLPGFEPSVTDVWFTITNIGGMSSECDCQQRAAGKCRVEFIEQRIWPAEAVCENHSVGQILARIDRFKIPDMSDLPACKMDRDCLHILRSELADDIEKLKQKARDLRLGMCLDCYKAEGMPPPWCRVAHSEFFLEERPSVQAK